MAQKLASANNKLQIENEVLAGGIERCRTKIQVQAHTIQLQKELNHKLRSASKSETSSDLTSFEYGNIKFRATKISKIVTKEGEYRFLVGSNFSLVASEGTTRYLDIKFKKRQVNKTQLKYKPIRLKVRGFGSFLTRVAICPHLPTKEGKAKLVSTGKFRFANLPVLDQAVCCFCATTNTITSGL